MTEDTREEEKQRGGPRHERQRQGQRGEKKKGAMDGGREGGRRRCKREAENEVSDERRRLGGLSPPPRSSFLITIKLKRGNHC